MGGRVFKDNEGNPVSCRITKDKKMEIEHSLYNEFLHQVHVKTQLPGLDFKSPNELSNKEDFGDVDIIVPFLKSVDYKDIIKEVYPDVECITRNGNIVHFLYENKYQIDLIVTPYKEMSFIQLYLSYGGLGMLLGILSRHLNIKFGMDGFSIRYNDVYISNDIFKVGEVFGIKDFNNKRNNIQTEEDLFKLVWSSDYASKERFLNSMTNCVHRKREKQSPFYAKFIKWIEQQTEKEFIKDVPESEQDLYNWLETVFSRDEMLKVYETEAKIAYEKVLKERRQNHFSYQHFLQWVYEMKLTPLDYNTGYGFFMPENKYSLTMMLIQTWFNVFMKKYSKKVYILNTNEIKELIREFILEKIQEEEK